MTDQPASSLVPLAKSWNLAPALSLVGPACIKGTYKIQERAFVFSGEYSTSPELAFTIYAAKDSPLVHPAFVVERWGETERSLHPGVLWYRAAADPSGLKHPTTLKVFH